MNVNSARFLPKYFAIAKSQTLIWVAAQWNGLQLVPRWIAIEQSRCEISLRHDKRTLVLELRAYAVQSRDPKVFRGDHGQGYPWTWQGATRALAGQWRFSPFKFTGLNRRSLTYRLAEQPLKFLGRQFASRLKWIRSDVADRDATARHSSQLD